MGTCLLFAYPEIYLFCTIDLFCIQTFFSQTKLNTPDGYLQSCVTQIVVEINVALPFFVFLSQINNVCIDETMFSLQQVRNSWVSTARRSSLQGREDRTACGEMRSMSLFHWM